MRKLLQSLVGIAVVISLTFVATPASAHPIHGSSWRDNDTICQGCAVNRGNIVRLWQTYLWSALGPSLGDCTVFADGVFGARTAAATRTWQSQRGLAADGVVGPDTWGRALELSRYSHSAAGYAFWTYAAGHATVWLRRSQTTSIWEFQPPAGAGYNGTDHPGIGPHVCNY